MSASASSLTLSSLNPKTLSLCAAKPTSASLLPISSSCKLRVEPLSISFFASSGAKCLESVLSSRFVRHVTFSDDLDLDDDAVSDEGEASFSPDLKLFVGNLPFNVDSSQLAELFEGAGNVEMVEVIYDKVTGRSRGFAFVTMSSAEEVKRAVQQLNGYELDGRELRVNSGPPPPKRDQFSSRGSFDRDNYSSRGSFPRESRDNFSSRGSFPRGGSGRSGGGPSSGSSNRVYVGNLSWGVDDMALETLFSEQGKVVEARVIYDRDSGRSKGFGFVSFSSSQEVNNAVESLNGVDLDGRQIRVSVAEARPPRREF